MILFGTLSTNSLPLRMCICLHLALYACDGNTVASQQIENTDSSISLFNLYRHTLPAGQVDNDDVTGPTTEPPIQQLSSTRQQLTTNTVFSKRRRRLQRPWPRASELESTEVSRDVDMKQCDKDGLNDDLKCNETNMERCVSILDRVTRCSCLPGFSRANDGSHRCIAIRYYRGTLKTWLQYENELQDKTSSMYRLLEFDARNALHSAAMSSRLRPVMVDIRVSGFTESISDQTTTIHYDILLPRQYAPDPSLVRQDLIDGILRVLPPSSDQSTDMFILVNSSIGFTQTDILITADDINAITITVVMVGDVTRDVMALHIIPVTNSVTAGVDSCSDRLLNYCDVTATCNMTSYGGFECVCQQGFIDISPNRVEASGERCTLMCGTNGCQNGAQCLYDGNGVPYCRCSSWFLGSSCTIDAKVLLIIVVTSSAVVTLLVILTCFCGVTKLQNNYAVSFQHSNSIDARSNDSPTDSSHVVGWKDTDTWKFYALVNRYKTPSDERPQLVPVHNRYGHSYFAYGPDFFDDNKPRQSSSTSSEVSEHLELKEHGSMNE